MLCQRGKAGAVRAGKCGKVAGKSLPCHPFPDGHCGNARRRHCQRRTAANPADPAKKRPFPGPGLAIRVIGDITDDKLDILKEADAIFREEIANAGLHKSINQYFAVLTNLKSVGVMGDERTYDYTVALRAVETTDFMTGVWSKIPYEVLEKVSSRIVNEVNHVNRVVYDITSKPPATIEWE